MAAYPSTSPLPITRNSDIEATINGYKWNFEVGTPRIINWSVSGSTYWGSPLLRTAETQDDFGTLFSFVADYINVSFAFLGYFETTESTAGYRSAYAAGSNMNISFGYNGVNSSGQIFNDGKFQNSLQTGYCYFPAVAFDVQQYQGAAGDTWLNWNSPFIRSLDYEVGSVGFALLLHEVLHGLGLKHPHDSGGTGRPTYEDLDMPFIDRQWVSVMSYDLHENGGDGAYYGSMPIAPMIMDVIALQYLYGESKSDSGDSTYDLSYFSGKYYNTLWDSAGNDTLDASDLTYAVYVEMGIGEASNGTNIHNIGYVTTALDQLSLSVLGFSPSRWTWLWGEFENFIGSSYSDIATGNALDNVMNGGNGNDILYGGEGNDIFDWDPGLRGGADTFYGGSGDDIYVLDSIYDTVIEYDYEGIDLVYAGFDYSIEGTAIENLSAFSNMSVGVRFDGSDWGNRLTGGFAADTLVGWAGDDSLIGKEGNDALYGGTGTDLAIFWSTRSSATISKTAAGHYTVTSAVDGRDSLFNIERLQFANGSIALDVGVNDPAGKTALLLGAVLPGQLVFDASKEALLGSVIDLFDQGYSLRDLSGAVLRLPVWDVLTGKAAPVNSDIANYLLSNVLGASPNQSALNAATNALNTEAFQGDWLANLASSSENQAHVGLVGLMDIGLDYITPPG